jgi:hypothetical protein
MQNFYFYTFYFFIFYFLLFFGAGPSSTHMGWAGLYPAGPARPDHWPKPVTRLGHMKHA